MRVTNDDFRRHDQAFRAACTKAGVEPTKRQASKFRRQEGRAYAALPQAITELRTAKEPS